jgi:hypothetical protein
MLEHLSPLQFIKKPDGTMGLKGQPSVTLETVEGQGQVKGRDWQSELFLPKYREDWEALARPRGLSARRVSFVLMDEAPTNQKGHPRLRPEMIELPTSCQFELGHTGFVVGIVNYFVPLLRSQKLSCSDEPVLLPSLEPFSIPFTPEGSFVVAHARLYDSPLAEAAWLGITRGIFSHVCPIIFRPFGAPADTGTLLQVSLVPGDFPGCPNARIMRQWEEVAGG